MSLLKEWDWKNAYMLQARPESLRDKLRESVEDIRKLLTEQDTLLDVGCGEGVLYSILQHDKYTGIDRDAPSIKRARAANPGVDFRVGDLFDLTGSWDVVVCSRVLIHLPHFEQTMKVLLGLTRKHCVITVKIDVDCVEREERDGSYYRTFSEKTLRSIGDCKINRYVGYSAVIYAPPSH